MRIFSRIGMAGVAAAGVLGATALGAAEPERPRLVAAADQKPFVLSEARGRFVALHFLGTDGERGAAFVREYVKAAPGVAGVRHVFVGAGAAEARALAAGVPEAAGMVFVDDGGALARSLGLERSGGEAGVSPTTVVLDPKGEELVRLAGSPAFAEFARRVNERGRAAAIAEYNLPSGGTLAVEGYDVVAYFRLNKATKGRPELRSWYRGVEYRFSSDEHLRLFAAQPERYLPTYGGWCASAMGDKGTKVGIDPTNFKVKDGRLFLFYKSLLGDALKDWNKKEKVWEPAADANWKRLSGEDPVRPAADEPGGVR